MDRIKETADIIIKINKYRKGTIPQHEIIKEVCNYFDSIKNDELTSADKQFLFNIANQIGIPHYFDTLEKFGKDTDLESVSMETMSNCLRECQLYTNNETKLHRYQKEILDKFQKQQANRYFLSASTSFGKTFLVYEIIFKMEYKNVLLIFPSIALLSENLEKINSDSHYSAFKERYNVNTISNGEIDTTRNNIFLFTPERYLSFLDFHGDIQFDFVFVDEVYKMDNDYLEDEEMKENERDIAYRLALFYSLMDRTKDALLAGPYIEFSDKNSPEYNPSFDKFMEDCKIELLNYNDYEIVDKEYKNIPNKQKREKFKKQLIDFRQKKESVIVYCSRRSDTERYAKYLVEDNQYPEISTQEFQDFYNHIKNLFDHSNDWIVVKALKKGIGIHHGLIPKFIQKEIINLFNKGIISVLLSTTTITEGVNTVAKNVLVLSHKKGDKELKTFDALNIAGRAGRFMSHYKGMIYTLDKEFLKIKDGKDEPIKHKNYDLDSPKQEIDLLHTNDEYLNNQDKQRKQLLNSQIKSCDIPRNILEKFKVISIPDKIQIYQHIRRLSYSEQQKIKGLIQKFAINRTLDYDGFETIIPIILPFVKNEKLRFLMNDNQPGKNNKRITAKIYLYFKRGFKGMVNGNKYSIDDAVKETADFIYNTLKYQVVKYLGVFNLMYKYYLSVTNNKSFEEVVGIDSLLMKLEYNATTEKGRIASDYGVPQKIIDYYENEGNNSDIQFDSYERLIFERIDKIINK